MLHADFYSAAIGAVARVGRPALVVTPYRDLLPDPLPAHARWVPSLPFAAVLPAVDAIVHHGGIGTAMRALRSGTPQVILAHGLDRPDNAARLAHLGLAEWSTPDGWHVASKMLGRALADTGYPARAANQLRDDDPKHAVSAAAEVLEGLLAVTSAAREAR
jgi:UDP:flavonoid glycosyltransferase YjiC (YdhE family)